MVSVSNGLDIQFDKASKFYEPGESVSGTIKVMAAKTYMDHGEVTLLAEAFMDTVSAIRGNLGRKALEPHNRIMFMSKTVQVSPGGKAVMHEPLKFSFVLEQTGEHPLIDAYVGVDFSIVYKVSIKLMPATSGQLPIDGSAQFYCMVPGAGIDPSLGKKFVPQDFSISPDGL